MAAAEWFVNLHMAFLALPAASISQDTISQRTDTSRRPRPFDAMEEVIDCISNGRLNQNLHSMKGLMQCNLGYRRQGPRAEIIKVSGIEYMRALVKVENT